MMIMCIDIDYDRVDSEKVLGKLNLILNIRVLLLGILTNADLSCTSR